MKTSEKANMHNRTIALGLPRPDPRYQRGAERTRELENQRAERSERTRELENQRSEGSKE